jgi:hypothetical protein
MNPPDAGVAEVPAMEGSISSPAADARVGTGIRVSGVARISEPGWTPCIAVARRGGLLWPKESEVAIASSGHFVSDVYEGGASGIMAVMLLAVPPEG